MSKPPSHAVSSFSWPEGFDLFGSQARGSMFNRPAGKAPSPPILIGQTQILALLHEIGKELTSILDLDELLRTVGERVKELVDYDMFNMMLLNNMTQRLEHGDIVAARSNVEKIFQWIQHLGRRRALREEEAACKGQC